MPRIGEIPAGRVLVTYHEGLATHDRWPIAGETVPAESMRWITQEMAIPRLPLRYDDWGILTAWRGPVLVRAAADIQLPQGKQEFLMRARGMGRLWVNGALIARTKAHNGTGDGHEPVKPIPAPPLPGLRPLSFGDEEGIGQAEIGADGRCRIVVEVLVGGKKFRPEPGEMCVAVKSADRKSFVLIQPGTGDPEPLTDAMWQAVTARAETELAAMDDAARHSAAASQDAFWKTRHYIARNWVQTHPAPTPPKSESADSSNVIDQFIQRRIDLALANSAGAAGEQAKQFHASVLPVLAENCFRCHGEKSKGGLRLNTRQAAIHRKARCSLASAARIPMSACPPRETDCRQRRSRSSRTGSNPALRGRRRRSPPPTSPVRPLWQMPPSCGASVSTPLACSLLKMRPARFSPTPPRTNAFG
jgi:hypothetical protein